MWDSHCVSPTHSIGVSNLQVSEQGLTCNLTIAAFDNGVKLRSHRDEPVSKNHLVLKLFAVQLVVDPLKGDCNFLTGTAFSLVPLFIHAS